MALFLECIQKCCRKLLDTADIVRDGDFSPTDPLRQNQIMSTARIEEAILSVVGERWKKVAMVIGKVSDAMGTELPTGEERYELISERIAVLVQAGRLEVQGKTKNWRSSEVRRFGPEIASHGVLSVIKILRQLSNAR